MMRKLILALAFLLLPISVCHASSTVTASARDLTAANAEHFSITNAAQSGLSAGSNVSWYMCGWIRLDAYGSFPIIVGKGNASTGWHFYLDDAGGDTKLIDRANAKTASGGTISLSTWTFFEIYYNATTDLLGISLNRGADSTIADTVGPSTSTQDFLISKFPGATNYWDGQMASWVYISGEPTTADRDALYNSGNGVLYKDKPTLNSGSYVSWWDGAETSGVLRDAHGSNTLTDNNTVTSAAGKVTYTAEDASDFEASTSEFLSLANASLGSLNPGDTNFTARCWIKAETLSGVTSIMGIWDGVNGNWLIYSNGTTLSATVQNSSGTNGSATYAGATTGTWYCLHMTYDATTDEVKIFVNGAQSGAAGTVSGGPRTAAGPFYFGKDGLDRYFDGLIAGGAFWTRELTDAEILTDFNRGFGQDYQGLQDNALTTNLYTYWPLSEASGTRVNQTATANKDLTDNNTVTGNPGVVYDAPAVSTRGRVMVIS